MSIAIAALGGRRRWALASLAVAAGMALALTGLGPAAGAAVQPGPLAAGKLAYIPFLASPFPYNGVVPETGKPFLDAGSFFQHGHTAPRGGVYWENPTYSDRRSLVYFPKGFDLRKPAVIVIYFHGNEATLNRDVVGRQQVPDQLAELNLNAVLLAPQFAVDALDSSAGNFWTAGGFARYLDEASANLASVYGDSSARAAFGRLPVIMVAYSGGYDPAAYALKVGGANRRIKGVVLLDSPFDDEQMFADFLAQNITAAFLFSAYTSAAAMDNATLEQMLAARRVPYTTTLPSRLAPGVVSFVATDPALNHDNFVTDAWVPDPLAWVLARISGYPR